MSYRRHDKVPVLTERPSSVEAVYFNRARVAVNRFGSELRLAIPGLKTLDLIVQPDAWIVVDRAFNDIPVIAWSNFETGDRGALHEPIACRLRLYHGHAGMILKRVLEAMEKLLGEQLLAGSEPTEPTRLKRQVKDPIWD